MLMPTYLLSNEFTAFDRKLRATSTDIVKFRKGETIIFPGDKRLYHYYILEGAVAYYLLSENGNRKIVTFRGCGTIFPLYYDYSSVIMEELMEFRAFSDVVMIRMNHGQVRQLIHSDADFSKAMMNAYCKYATILLYDLNLQMFSNSMLKTANFLYISISYMQDDSVSSTEKNMIRMTHEDIGTTIGVSRSNVTRALNTMKNDGIVELYKNSIYIPSKTALLKYCSDMAVYFENHPSSSYNN